MDRAAPPCRTLLAGAGLLLLALLGAGCGGSDSPPPNVVMVVIDTLRSDHLGCYGHHRDTTPHIDRLAAAGVRYRRAISQAPWTTPSVGALLTSRYPSELGIRGKPDRLEERFVLLSEVLRDRGYATGAVVSHYFLGSKWNFGQGFGVYDESNVLGHAAVSGEGVTDAAVGFLEDRGEDPFFLFAHYFDPHYDYIEHPEHRFSDPAYDGPVTSGMVYTDLLALRDELTAADLAHLRDLYDSEIAYTDHQVGRLLDELHRRGLWDDTLVVLTADHGEEFMERTTIGHGGTLYQELIHVPLIVKYPGGAGAGRTVEGNVGLIDVYPTVLEVLGLEVPQHLSGRSFLGAGPGAEPPPRPVFSETDWTRWRAVLDGDAKLMRRLTNRQEELFDLAADPGEARDLVPWAEDGAGGVTGPGARLDRLDRRLSAWLTWVERRAARAGEVEIDDDLRRELEALGYLR